MTEVTREAWSALIKSRFWLIATWRNIHGDGLAFADLAILLPQRFQLLQVQRLEPEHRVLRIFRYTQQLIDLQMQNIGITVLRVLNQEHHQKRDRASFCEIFANFIAVFLIGMRLRLRQWRWLENSVYCLQGGMVANPSPGSAWDDFSTGERNELVRQTVRRF